MRTSTRSRRSDTHEGKVDLIYIDPPYNTGAGDWIYNDRYVGDADAYRHSKWLSFMQKRLELARHLLAPTGVIIVAIDDNEHHRLRVLLDEVFGEQNFLGNVVWQGGRKNNVKFIADTHDYMLFFAKDKALLSTGDAWKESRPGYDELLQAGLDAWEESGHDAAAATALSETGAEPFRLTTRPVPSAASTCTTKLMAIRSTPARSTARAICETPFPARTFSTTFRTRSMASP